MAGGFLHRPKMHQAFVAKRNRGLYDRVPCQCVSCQARAEYRQIDVRKGRIRCERCGGNVVEEKYA